MNLQPFSDLLAFDGPLIVPDSGTLRALDCAFDHYAIHQQLRTWRPPVATTWSNWLGRQFEMDSLTGRGLDGVDFVLSRDQEHALWQAVIAADSDSGIEAPETAAALAAEAWQLQILWDIAPPPASGFVSADIAAFARWCRAYQERAAQLRAIDTSQLLHRDSASNSSVQRGLSHGFIDEPPRLRRWLERNTNRAPDAGSNVARVFSTHAYRDREQELLAALHWADRCSRRDPGARIAVVLDSMRDDEQLVRRCCRDVFGATADGSSPECFISARERLAMTPTLRLALLLVELAPLTRWDHLSELIRHPLLAGAGTEASARAVFDDELRALERYEVPLPFVIHRLSSNASCQQLLGVLKTVAYAHGALARRQSMADWLRHFDACLRAGGWPGDGDCEPERARVINVWGTICDRMNALDAVLSPVTRSEAVSLLRRMLNDSSAGPSTPQRGVFVLTASEALVIDPTHVWLAGCEHEVLVGGARVSPLLVLDSQRAAGLPGADPARRLARARTLLAGLSSRSVEHHASYALGDGELRFTPSPLLPELVGAVLSDPQTPLAATWSQQPARLEWIADASGPAVAATDAVRGGVGVIAAQSACGFRAFARHRLGAKPVEEPKPGISARHKGSVVHRVLARLWSELADRGSLAALTPAQRQQRVVAAIQRELVPLPFETAIEREVYSVERERLLGLIDRWLVYETERADFSVIACEQSVETEFGGLSFVTRLDRVDRLADGSLVIVDYKTGRCSVRDWDTPRMTEPQLPYYALTAPFEAVAGVAYATVDRARPNWLQAPEARYSSDWATTLTAWKIDLEHLTAEFKQGRAVVDPKRGPETCRYCDQSLFCRRLDVESGDVFTVVDGSDD